MYRPSLFWLITLSSMITIRCSIPRAWEQVGNAISTYDDSPGHTLMFKIGFEAELWRFNVCIAFSQMQLESPWVSAATSIMADPESIHCPHADLELARINGFAPGPFELSRLVACIWVCYFFECDYSFYVSCLGSEHLSYQSEPQKNMQMLRGCQHNDTWWKCLQIQEIIIHVR